jgi:hypothetical protein
MSANCNIADDLHVYQFCNDLAELTVVLYNETRWEGRFLVLSRFLALGESLPILINSPCVLEQRRTVADFLTCTFFDRIRLYLPFLSKMNDVSLLYQTQKFPTGHLVPLCAFELLRLFGPSNNDQFHG